MSTTILTPPQSTSLSNHSPSNTNSINPTKNDSLSNPRTLSIRFAPLPDPRASRANIPASFGHLDVWWSREERPDGNWGDYRLVLRRPNGQIIAIDQLDPRSDERIRALEAYRQLHPSRPSPTPLSSISRPPHFSDSDSHSNFINHHLQSTCSPDQSLSQSSANLTLLLPPLSTQSSNLSHSSSILNLHSAGSTGSYNPLALTPTASCDSTHSNYLSPISNQKIGSTSSLTKKFIDAMKKPIVRHSHRLTSTNSLPIHGDYFGAPLSKSRSADSTNSIRKKWGFGFPKQSPNLRRTRSKEESSNYSLAQSTGLDEPPVRRRANYPPVAQRKVHMGGSRGGAGKVVLTEEPEFVEWKSATAQVSSTKLESGVLSNLPNDEDGSGMAWLRKRKREREERARREEEERARCMMGDTSRSALPLATINENILLPTEPLDIQVTSPEIDSNEPSTSRAGKHRSLNSEDEKKDEDRDSSASSIYQSSIMSRNDAQASGGTRTSTSSATISSKDSNGDDDEDLNEEELKEEERLKALALSQSPFVRGASEVYRDREHHRILRKSTERS